MDLNELATEAGRCSTGSYAQSGRIADWVGEGFTQRERRPLIALNIGLDIGVSRRPYSPSWY